LKSEDLVFLYPHTVECIIALAGIKNPGVADWNPLLLS